MADALMDAWKNAEASGDYSGFGSGLRDSGLSFADLGQRYNLTPQDLAYMQSRPVVSNFVPEASTPTQEAAPAAPTTPAASEAPVNGIASLISGLQGLSPEALAAAGGMYQDPTTGRGVHAVYGAGRYDPLVGDYVAGDPTEYWVSDKGATRDARSPFQVYSPQGEYLRSGNYEPATDINKQLLKYGAALAAWGGLGSLAQGAGAGVGAPNAAQEAFRLSEIAAQNAGAGALEAGTAGTVNAAQEAFRAAEIAAQNAGTANTAQEAFRAAEIAAQNAGTANTAQEAFRAAEIAAQNAGAGASAATPTLLDTVTKGTGSTLLDKVINKATTPAGLAALAAMLAGTTSGGGGGGYAGYSGGIPELRATRTQYANDPTRRPGGAPQRYFSDIAYTSDMNGPGLVQASDPTAGAWQAGNVPEVNRLLSANKPTLQKLIEAYNLSPADIEFLKTRGVNLPAGGAATGTAAGVASLPRTLTEEQSRAPVGDELAQAWKDGNIGRVNTLLNAKKSRQELDQVIKKYNLSPADVAHLRGQGVQLAAGGITSLGAYSDGGRMVKGPGDGVSDDVPAMIGGAQPAALANDEFVVPARVVAELGNGSSEAGAKKLYAMMDRVEAAARKAKRGQDSKAERFLPA